MVEFRKQDVHERIAGLAGTPAETAFVNWQASRGRTVGSHVVRFGFDQVDTSAGLVATVEPMLRHVPDFVTIGGHLYEVQGCGDGRWSVKEEKLNALHQWDRILSDGRQLRWFLYRSDEQTAVVCTHQVLTQVLLNSPDVEWLEDLFDGKPGWVVPETAFSSWLVAGDPFYAEKVQRRYAA